MKGLEITYNGQTMQVAVKNGLTAISIFTLRGNGNMSVWGADHCDYKLIIWDDNASISLGDRFEIKVAEISESSEPKKWEDYKDIKPPVSKLERFYSIKKYLKERGLL